MKHTIEPGDKVRIHPTGIIFEVVSLHNTYAAIVDAHTKESYPLTPVSLLYKVEDS